MNELELRDFEEKCITCLNWDIVDENWNNKTKCDKWWSLWSLNDWCSANYLKDESAFDTGRIHTLLWDNFTLEEDYK